MAEIKSEILKTLAFYDIFEYPLTPLEIHKNLGTAADFADVAAALNELKIENKIIMESGYFFLAGREDLAAERKARFLISFKKLERAKKIARLFAWFPFIKFIGACNSLGYFNAAEGSDIDFFIITRRGRIWITRFLTTIPLIIFNLRPKAGNMRDKFCLSFYVADNALDISSVALREGDPYFYHWFCWILPLYDDGIWQKFIGANGWVKNYFPNFVPQNNYFALVPRSLGEVGPRPRFIKKIFEKLFFLPEKFFRWGQTLAMPRELKEAVFRGDNSVVINDEMLKFHLLDRREEYKNNYELRIKNYE